MAHIDLDPELPGIVGLLKGYPATAQRLVELAEHVLRVDSPGLSMAEREIIAGYVARLGNCEFCELSHAKIGEKLLGKPGLVAQAVCDLDSADLTPLMKALLRIAAKVHAAPKSVTAADVDAARRLGAGDREIHDTVLIAAMFCMYYRYVDGLGTLTPDDPSAYDEGVNGTIEKGYVGRLRDLLES
jgi:uncharacterized peroxidase-related enzyme